MVPCLPDAQTASLGASNEVPRGLNDEEPLTAGIIELAHEYGRYGNRKIVVPLRDASWRVNDKQPARSVRRTGDPFGRAG